jgi:hypothetical protein
VSRPSSRRFTSLHMSFRAHKNLSQWGRWAALAPELPVAPQSDDESIESRAVSHMRDVTHGGQPTSSRETTSPLLKLEVTAKHSFPLPPSHILSAPQDSYHTTTTYLHLPPTNKACFPPHPSSQDLRHTKTSRQLVSHVPNRWIGAHSPVKMTLYYSLVSSLSPPT